MVQILTSLSHKTFADIITRYSTKILIQNQLQIWFIFKRFRCFRNFYSSHSSFIVESPSQISTQPPSVISSPGPSSVLDLLVQPSRLHQ